MIFSKSMELKFERNCSFYYQSTFENLHHNYQMLILIKMNSILYYLSDSKYRSVNSDGRLYLFWFEANKVKSKRKVSTST